MNTIKENYRKILEEALKHSPLADKKCEKGVLETYSFLKAIGLSDKVMYGHQNDNFDKAGSPALSCSDTEDIAGSIAAVCGFDGLSLVGNEFNAKRYNAMHEDKLKENPEGNLAAGIWIINEALKKDAIITLSAHMSNFSLVPRNPDYKEGKDPECSEYIMSEYTPNRMDNDIVHNILPGKPYNRQFHNYLDTLAECIKNIHGTILIRPFHENTGSWFWWGERFCTPEEFKELYRYVYNYLVEKKDCHNLIFAYSPGSEPRSVEEFEERYPGDDYVDMVGFDMYDRTHDDAWVREFREQVRITSDFAKKHNKLFAVTETGIANETAPGDKQTALAKSGNKMSWYMDVLDSLTGTDACYFLLWANFAKDNGYYTPYVDRITPDGKRIGHEMIPAFTKFANDPRTLFAADIARLKSDL